VSCERGIRRDVEKILDRAERAEQAVAPQPPKRNLDYYSSAVRRAAERGVRHRKEMSITTLYFLCGKMAAGKSTLARKLARTHQAVLLEEDHFLAILFPGEIHSIADYVKYSARVKEALSEHIVSLLRRGISVVLDFPANTPNQRRWFRQLIDRSQVAHELHYLDVTDEVCKARLRERSKSLPEATPFTSDAEFEAVTKYFQPAEVEEGFNVVKDSDIHSP
jgi:predicted kinase